MIVAPVRDHGGSAFTFLGTLYILVAAVLGSRVGAAIASGTFGPDHYVHAALLLGFTVFCLYQFTSLWLARNQCFVLDVGPELVGLWQGVLQNGKPVPLHEEYAWLREDVQFSAVKAVAEPYLPTLRDSSFDAWAVTLMRGDSTLFVLALDTDRERIEQYRSALPPELNIADSPHLLRGRVMIRRKVRRRIIEQQAADGSRAARREPPELLYQNVRDILANLRRTQCGLRPDPTKHLSPVEQEFADRGILRADALLLKPRDALQLVRRCRDRGVPIRSITGFQVTDTITHPDPDQRLVLNVSEPAPDPWTQAEDFLQAQLHADLHFEVVPTERTGTPPCADPKRSGSRTIRECKAHS